MSLSGRRLVEEGELGIGGAGAGGQMEAKVDKTDFATRNGGRAE